MLYRYTQGLQSIVNSHTLATVALAVFSTWLCRRYGFYADFPLTLIGTAVIFPIVFSIGGAYKRREAALDDYGAMKANGTALFFAARDWLPDADPALQDGMRERLFELMLACRNLFESPVAEINRHEQRVHDAFSELSVFINKMRAHGLPSGEASRCNQFLSKMVVSFEHIKHVYQYRTPQTLRAYSKFFIVAIPILYGPYFAAQSLEYSAELAYVIPVLLSVVLVSLDNIQEHLEDPFDQVGRDDLMINAEKFNDRLLAATQPRIG